MPTIESIHLKALTQCGRGGGTSKLGNTLCFLCISVKQPPENLLAFVLTITSEPEELSAHNSRGT